MKKKICIASFILIAIAFFSCEPKECEEGYVRVYGDNGSDCIPRLDNGANYNPDLGNIYYHEAYGIITFKNNKWYNEHQIEVEILIEK